VQQEVDALAGYVAAARAGDAAAGDALLRELRPSLLRYATARLGSRERAEDVTQETCLALVTALPRYEDRGVPFAAFAFRVAHNKIADAHREAVRRPLELVRELPDAADGAPGPEDHVERGERVGLAKRLLAVLPDHQRDVLLLRVAAGLSAQETADVLGTTPGAVRVTQHRALTKLRQLAGSGA